MRCARQFLLEPSEVGAFEIVAIHWIVESEIRQLQLFKAKLVGKPYPLSTDRKPDG
jgi:hypothetical protein